jgi:glycosyltransferase involved in cell wall biosynthesis
MLSGAMRYSSVTIITVCYNAASTIGNTLASVRSQTYPNIEHIVIDGMSDDGTQAIIERELLSDGIFLSEPDSGIYNAMNKGLLRASGDVIAFLNSDDCYAHDDAIANVMTAFENADDINAIFGDVAFYREHSRGHPYRRYDSGMFRPSRLRWGWMPAHPGMFVAQSVYNQLRGFREDFKIAADYEFVARGFARGLFKYRHLPEVLVHMLAGGVSTRSVASRLLINRETVLACRMNGIYTNRLMVMSKYPMKLLGYLR